MSGNATRFGVRSGSVASCDRARRVRTVRYRRAAGIAAVFFAFVAVASAEDDLVGEVVDEQARQNQVRINLDDQLRGLFGGDDRTLDRARERALAGGMLDVERVDRICRLDDAQARALRAAARSDATRATVALERMLARWGGRTLDFRDARDQALWQEFHQDLSAVQAASGRAAPQGSLLARVLEGTLDERQRAVWAEETRRRTERVWRMVVERQILKMQAIVGLTEAQSRAIEAILMEKPIPFDVRSVSSVMGDSFDAMGSVAVARADRDRLLAVVGDARRKELEDHRSQSQAVEQLLRGRGAIGE